MTDYEDREEKEKLKWQRAALHDPKRCQTRDATSNQCPYIAQEGSIFCPRHIRESQATQAAKAANMYRLGAYQARVEELSTHSEIKNLRAEIGILRMILEKIIDSCHGEDVNLIAYSGQISDTTLKLRTLISTCHKIDIQLGAMLDRDKVMLIGYKIVEIISEVLPPDQHHLLDAVGEKIASAIMEISIN